MSSMYRHGKISQKLILFLFLCCPVWHIHAQEIDANTPWIWMGGDTTLSKPGLYGTKGVAGADNRPGARSQAASWTDTLGNFWLFGGRVYGSSVTEALRNDMWKYSPFAGQWTWVSGDSTTNGPAVPGTTGIPSVNNTPSARSLTNYWIDKDGLFWVMGGVASPTAASRRNDLWRFNPYTQEWTLIRGNPATADAIGIYGTMGTGSPANTPGARSAAACWADTSGNLWLFGGQGQTSTTALATGLSDWWKYNISSNEWTWMGGPNTASPAANYGTQGVMAPTNIPGGRYLPVTWRDTSGNFWMMGGVGYVTTSSGMLNDLWKFSPALNQWVWMQGTNTLNDAGLYISQGTASANRRPKARRTTTTWIDLSGNLWLFGGTTAAFFTAAVNDIWKYNIASNEWTWVKGDSTSNTLPVYNLQGVANPANEVGARGTEVSWRSRKNNNVWIFGGHIPAYSTRNDLWKIEACAPVSNLGAIAGPDTVCAGDTVVFSVPPISNPLSYVWTIPNGWTSTVNGHSVTVVPNSSGTISVRAVSTCSDSTNLRTLDIMVGSVTVPVISQSVSGGILTLSVSNTYTTYQWYLNDTAITGATTASYNPAVSGTYTVAVTSATGCAATSDAVTVGLLGLNELEIAAGIRVYPNPVVSDITVLCKINAVATITDIQGRVLSKHAIRPGKSLIKAADLSEGLYFIVFKTKDANQITTIKMVKK